MLEVHWNSSRGWGKPRIGPVHDFDFPVHNSGLNYGLVGIEGMKAYYDSNTKTIRTFRPDKYAERLNKTSEGLSFPTFDPNEFIKCLDELLKQEEIWASPTLYIRPILFSLTNHLSLKPPNDIVLLITLSPDTYSQSGCTPVTLKVERNGFNSWVNGTRCFRPGGSSTISFKHRKAALDGGFDQVLWVYGKKITDTDNSNVFIHMLNDYNEEELITPVADGSVLPGIYREVIMEFARERKDLKVKEKDIEIMKLHDYCKRNKILEIFLCGTELVVAPVKSITYNILQFRPISTKGKMAIELYNRLQDIHVTLIVNLVWKNTTFFLTSCHLNHSDI